MTRTVYLLQGLAHDTDNWDEMLQFIPSSISVKKVDVLALGFIGKEFSLEKAAQDLEAQIEEESAVICGLSYGAVVAIKHASYYSNRKHTYLLSGQQVHPPRMITKTLRFFWPFVYKAMEWHGGQELDSDKVKSILKAYDRLNLKEELKQIENEVVVMIGKRDLPHYKAAIQMSNRLKTYRLILVEKAGHEMNHSGPAEMAHQIKRFS